MVTGLKLATPVELPMAAMKVVLIHHRYLSELEATLDRGQSAGVGPTPVPAEARPARSEEREGAARPHLEPADAVRAGAATRARARLLPPRAAFSEIGRSRRSTPPRNGRRGGILKAPISARRSRTIPSSIPRKRRPRSRTAPRSPERRAVANRGDFQMATQSKFHNILTEYPHCGLIFTTDTNNLRPSQ